MRLTNRELEYLNYFFFSVYLSVFVGARDVEFARAPTKPAANAG